MSISDVAKNSKISHSLNYLDSWFARFVTWNLKKSKFWKDDKNQLRRNQR